MLNLIFINCGQKIDERKVEEQGLLKLMSQGGVKMSFGGSTANRLKHLLKMKQRKPFPPCTSIESECVPDCVCSRE